MISPRARLSPDTLLPVPLSFSNQSWKRFRLNCEHIFLAMIPDAPTLKQRMAIETMITLAFNARKQEKLARKLNGREATEAMRLTTQNWAEFHRQLSDFERTLSKSAAAALPPSKPPPSLDQHLETVRQQRSTPR